MRHARPEMQSDEDIVFPNISMFKYLRITTKGIAQTLKN